MKKTPSYKLQAIVTTPGKWPYVGNGYLNRNDSITLLLDRGITLELADGTRLSANAAGPLKVLVRKPFGQPPGVPLPREAPAEAGIDTPTTNLLSDRACDTAATTFDAPEPAPTPFYSGIHFFG